MCDRDARRLAYDPEYILAGRHSNGDFLDIDLAVLRAVQSNAHVRSEDQMWGFTVHASTLHARRGREPYLTALMNVAPEIRNGSFITIAEVEKGAPLMSIVEWCQSLRPLVKFVTLDLHYSDHAIGSIAGSGAWAAGFHLPACAEAQSGARAHKTLEHVRFWMHAFRDQNVRAIVNGFRDSAFLGEAAALGVHLATSDVFWPFSIVDPGKNQTDAHESYLRTPRLR